MEQLASTHSSTQRYARRILASFVLVFFTFSFLLFFGTDADAETAEELRQKISNSQSQLAEIEKEIAKYEAQLNEVGAEKKTLQNAIRELDLSRDKLKAEVRATEKKISSTDLEIEELNREIHVKELEIQKNVDAIGQSFRNMDQMENQSVVEVVFANNSIADVWEVLEEQSLLRGSLRESTKALSALKDEYERAKNNSLEKRGELGKLKSELSGEETVLAGTIRQKDSLLDQTKNEEAEYQKLLEEKRAAKEHFEKQMREFESQLQFILNPATIPTAGSGVLKWPFQPTYMASCPSYAGVLGNSLCITQYFGNTEFARSGAYNGYGHNGVDFRASIGTPITAALSGTVIGVNHQDAPNCQYGLWVLVKHGNGLTTLYAHLSSISVANGQFVETGQVLGYSGSTGYSTGPHLHLSVYASDAVTFKQYTCNSGPTVTVPISAYSGYLNPLDYL